MLVLVIKVPQRLDRTIDMDKFLISFFPFSLALLQGSTWCKRSIT